ncbi:MAG: hypothetical protein HQK61_08715 [Desulfamplus sp.]|nr:hypothetical protein [Desulfamplus sp.]
MITYVLYAIALPLMLLISPLSASGPEQMTTTPTIIYSQLGGEHQITINGGLPPYRWYSLSGDIDKQNEHQFTYTAPNRFGTDKVTFEDRTGNKVQIEINIPRPLSLSPTRFDLGIDGEAQIRVSGGSGQWCVKEHQELEILDTTPTHLTIRPDGKIGLKNIVIQDVITHESVVMEINVFGNMEIKVEK